MVREVLRGGIRSFVRARHVLRAVVVRSGLAESDTSDSGEVGVATDCSKRRFTFATQKTLSPLPLLADMD